MMNIWKKTLAVVLAGSFVVCSFAGCGEKEGTVPEADKQNVKKTIKETEYDFIKGGTTEYSIVIPEEASENEQFAAREMQYFVEGATGAVMEILNESDDLKDGSYLYIGATKASEEKGVSPTYEEVKYNGFAIKQIDDDVYLRGYYDIGTRNSIYEFLDYAFDYEFYAADEIHLTETSDAKMLAYDLVEVPDFDWRDGGYGEMIYHPTISRRMRMNDTEEIMVTDRLVHNSMTIIDPHKYDWRSDEYKDWYSETLATDPLSTTQEERPAQLCYSNEEMREEYTKNLIEMVSASDAPNMLLGMEDNTEWCTCEKCTANKEKYGTDAATMIHFINYVQEELNVWFKENMPERQPTMLVMFAYYQTINPPVKFNEEKEIWEPIDETVVLNDSSAIMFAPITAEYDVTFDSYPIDDKENVNGQLAGWSAITDTKFSWTYSLFPLNGLMLFDAVEVMQQNYQLLLDNGTSMIMDQADIYQQNCNSGFSRLKGYLMSKLQWDNSLNMDELINDFFDNYFAQSSDTMQELFDREREWLTYIYATTDATGRISDQLLDSTYWNYNQLQSYMSLIDQAMEDIEPLRETDPDRYNVLYDRILLEGMQFRYILLSVYYTEYDSASLLEERMEFRADFERLGLTSYAENRDINDVWTEWGIK